MVSNPSKKYRTISSTLKLSSAKSFSLARLKSFLSNKRVSMKKICQKQKVLTQVILGRNFYAAADRSGHTIFLPSVSLSAKNFNIDHNFGLVSDRAFIFHKCIPCGRTFL